MTDCGGAGMAWGTTVSADCRAGAARVARSASDLAASGVIGPAVVAIRSPTSWSPERTGRPCATPALTATGTV